MAAEPSVASDLCTACGLCCDGTLFGFVQLAVGEEVPLQGTKIVPVTRGEKFGFHQPCQMLGPEGCGCYAVRPVTCRRYRCTTLIALDEGAVLPAEAHARVASARDAARAVQALVPEGQTLHAMLELAASPEDRAKVNPRLILQAGVLNLLLDRHFRKDHQKTLRGARSAA